MTPIGGVEGGDEMLSERLLAKISDRSIADFFDGLLRKVPNIGADDIAVKEYQETFPDIANPASASKPISGWRVAKSLLLLIEQVNEIAPGRNKASDGTIGDENHRRTDSDHNPWVIDGSRGVVTAADITHDPRRGCDCEAITAALVNSRDPRIKYIIWNRRMVRSYQRNGVAPWTWTAYAGRNGHTKHLHLSVLPDKTSYDAIDEWEIGQAAQFASLQLLNAANGLGAIAWGKRVSPDFKADVIAMCAALKVDPNYLMAAMAFETGRTFSPSIQNPVSKATGLIQFMPKTAARLGTSTAALAAMSANEQLYYVEKYFVPYAGKLNSLEDVYMAILWPRAVAKAASFVLFAIPSRAYAQNRGLDANSDGSVTKAEAADKVRRLLTEGMTDIWRG